MAQLDLTDTSNKPEKLREAHAIYLCLTYLYQESTRYGMAVPAHAIDVAAKAMAEAIEMLEGKKIGNKIVAKRFRPSIKLT
ncbi:MAG: hypothetical protein R3E60_00180 [Alphaproteobacteria bacterium]